MSSFKFSKGNIYSLLKLRSMMKTLRIEDMKDVEKSIYYAQGAWGWNFQHLVGGKLSVLLTLKDRLKALKKRTGFQEFRAEIMDNYKGADSSNNIILLVALYGTYANPTHIWRISKNKYVLYPPGIKDS